MDNAGAGGPAGDYAGAMLSLLAAALASPLALPVAGNTDAVRAGGWVAPEAWAAAPAWAVAGAPEVDALVLRGPDRATAPLTWEAQVGRPAAWTTLALAWVPAEVLGAGGYPPPFHGDRTPPGGVVGTVRWTATDGTTWSQPLRLDEEVLRIDAPAAGGRTRLLAAGAGRAVGFVAFANPTPALPLARVAIEARPGSGSLVVFGAAVEDAPPPWPVVGATPGSAPSEDDTGSFPFPVIPAAGPAFPRPAGATPEAPAGRRGFLTTRDGHLVFEDGTRARFWGINLVNEVNLPPVEAAHVLADQLAAAGFNLVRLHHVDNPRNGLARNGDPQLDAAALARFDALVAALEARGIYVILEIATQRRFTEADGVTHPDASVPNGHKLLPQFRPDWRAAWERWARAWLDRVNTVTGKRYADDPGVAMVELTNENSLIASWLAGNLEDLDADHRAALDVAWNDWLARRYPDVDAARTAWSGSVNPGLVPGEAWGTVRREPTTRVTFDDWPTQRILDLATFYDELDARFVADTRDLVRSLGYRVPLVGGITYQNPVIGETLGRLTDVVDTHLEWDTGLNRNDSMLSSPRSQALLDRWLEPQAGRPYMISEVSHAFPNDHGAEAPLFWAANASLQDWDAVVWFEYANGPWNAAPSGAEGPFALRDAGTRWFQMATASALFRGASIAPAAGSWTLARAPGVAREQLAARFTPSTALARDVGFVLAHRVRSSFDGVSASAGTSGGAGAAAAQVGWWVGPGHFVVDTPRVQAVLGRHDRRDEAGRGEGAGPVRSRGLEVQLDGFAAVSLAALDGDSLETASTAQLVVTGQMRNTGMLRAAGGTATLDWGRGPVLHARPRGVVRFAWPRRPEVRPVDPQGGRGAPVPVRAAGRGWWALDMETAGATLVWEVR